MKSGIYCILNSDSGKVYIGSAMNLAKRKSDHFCHLRRSDHKNSKLQKSFLKHGESQFSFHLLEQVQDKKDLVGREQFWIDIFEPSERYNIAQNAGSTLGYRHGDEALKKISRRSAGENNPNYGKRGPDSFHFGRKRPAATGQKISAALKGRIINPEWRRKAVETRRANGGFIISEETRKMISASGKGRIVSQETRDKISKTQRGRIISDETKKKMAKARIGRKLTREHCTHLAESQRARWARIKECK